MDMQDPPRAVMKSALILPKVGIMIEFKPGALFHAPARERREWDKESRTYKLHKPESDTPTTILTYDEQRDVWTMNPDGTAGVPIFLGAEPNEETTHIRVSSMARNGRSVFGTPFPTIHPERTER